MREGDTSVERTNEGIVEILFQGRLKLTTRASSRARIVRRHRGIFPPAEFRHLKLAAAPTLCFSEPSNEGIRILSLLKFWQQLSSQSAAF